MDVSRRVFIGAVFLSLICGLFTDGVAADKQTEGKDYRALAEKRAAVELDLISKRAELIREKPKLQKINQRITELYAQLHEELGKHPEIRRLRRQLKALETEISEVKGDAEPEMQTAPQGAAAGEEREGGMDD